jgi:hypothetical protein
MLLLLLLLLPISETTIGAALPAAGCTQVINSCSWPSIPASWPEVHHEACHEVHHPAGKSVHRTNILTQQHSKTHQLYSSCISGR